MGVDVGRFTLHTFHDRASPDTNTFRLVILSFSTSYIIVHNRHPCPTWHLPLSRLLVSRLKFCTGAQTECVRSYWLFLPGMVEVLGSAVRDLWTPEASTRSVRTSGTSTGSHTQHSVLRTTGDRGVLWTSLVPPRVEVWALLCEQIKPLFYGFSYN